MGKTPDIMTPMDGRNTAAAAGHAGSAAVVSMSRPGVQVIQPFEQEMNRRAEPRFDCNDHATLLLLSDGQEVSCRIVNQSASGAQVLVQDMPAQVQQLWLIDTGANTVRFGSPVWTIPHKMGLKFSFVQKLDPAASRPQRVPVAVWNTWRRLAGLDLPAKTGEEVLFVD